MFFGRGISNMFKKIGAGVSHLFKKARGGIAGVRKGIGLASTLLDNPISRALVGQYAPSLSGAFETGLGGLKTANQLAGRADDISKRAEDLGNTASRIRGIKSVGDIKDVAQDTLQRAKDIKRVAEGQQPTYLSFL
tara:strand:- start:1830 stop:2237 length:408 start_codon:yes stop_codon:yes gene_type:complete